MEYDQNKVRQSLQIAWKAAFKLEKMKDPENFNRDFRLVVDPSAVRELLVAAAQTGLLTDLGRDRILWAEGEEPKSGRVLNALAYANSKLRLN